MRILIRSAAIGLLCGSLPGPPPASAGEASVFVRAGRLLDGRGDSARRDMVIRIEGERIKEVGPTNELAIPEGARVVDLSDATVLPGLIDCHTHLQSRGDRFDP